MKISELYNQLINEELNKFNPHKYNSFSQLTEKDLYDIARWGLMNDFQISGAWDCADNSGDDKKDLEKASKCIVDGFKNLLKDKFPDGFNGIPNEVTIYRLITLVNPSTLNTKHLGFSWFTNINRIEDPDFTQQLNHLHKSFAEHEGKEVYLITAKVSQSKIDIPRSLFQRDMVYLENEIVLKDDTNIDVISLKKL